MRGFVLPQTASCPGTPFLGSLRSLGMTNDGAVQANTLVPPINQLTTCNLQLTTYNVLMDASPLVGVIMGSRSDYAVMSGAVEMLAQFGVAHEVRVVSAHRTPDLLFEYASTAAERGLRVIIAGAGGAAHLPGMVAAKTVVPVLGVPIPATALQGMDALLSIVQMPKGVPVGTLAIGAPGAANAGLLAAQIIATTDAALQQKLTAWRKARRDEVMQQGLEGLEKVSK